MTAFPHYNSRLPRHIILPGMFLPPSFLLCTQMPSQSSKGMPFSAIRRAARMLRQHHISTCGPAHKKRAAALAATPFFQDSLSISVSESPPHTAAYARRRSYKPHASSRSRPQSGSPNPARKFFLRFRITLTFLFPAPGTHWATSPRSSGKPRRNTGKYETPPSGRSPAPYRRSAPTAAGPWQYGRP